MTSFLPLLEPRDLSDDDLRELADRGHLVLPGIVASEVRSRLVESLAHVARLQAEHGPEGPDHPLPGKYAAEHDEFLASLIGHPQLLALARRVLGDHIRYDHCVALNRAGGNPGMRWHAHGYADDEPSLGFLRIFLYVNGFSAEDGGLKVVPGSHLFREAAVEASTDHELTQIWLRGRTHPRTGLPLAIERLSAPEGSVVLMWTHALHGVTARKADSGTRWTVVYAYRNPGKPSRARWITQAFEARRIAGAEGLLGLY